MFVSAGNGVVIGWIPNQDNKESETSKVDVHLCFGVLSESKEYIMGIFMGFSKNKTGYWMAANYVSDYDYGIDDDSWSVDIPERPGRLMFALLPRDTDIVKHFIVDDENNVMELVAGGTKPFQTGKTGKTKDLIKKSDPPNRMSFCTCPDGQIYSLDTDSNNPEPGCHGGQLSMEVQTRKEMTRVKSVSCMQTPDYVLGNYSQKEKSSKPAFMLVSLLQKTASHNSYALVLPGWNSYHEIIDNKKTLFNKYDSQKVIKGLVFSTTPEKSGAVFIAKIEKNKAENTVSFAILYSDSTTEHFQITDQTDFLNQRDTKFIVKNDQATPFHFGSPQKAFNSDIRVLAGITTEDQGSINGVVLSREAEKSGYFILRREPDIQENGYTFRMKQNPVIFSEAKLKFHRRISQNT